MVKEGKESELWADVTPNMMSEEEKDGDFYIRHQPSYRSNTLNKFIKKLDQRLEADINRKKHPCLLRTLGSPHKQHVPLKCKKWTEEADDTGDSAQEPQEGQELTGFSDADSAELV